ncbi:pep-2 [Cnaphalocrocis medinalis granulovirus]|uniref:Pep-2 n=1 Tax=Cnaphalocrocis medinalis granulovirus TaxID=1750712 RepID=A0A109WW32_9BBAC|nr:pep-2 [Cnaphalocrocis medinalis granulovirus]ALN41956.1 pep-2 [Cnaphalocrocis medinalis granulovirus]AMF83770.1 pep-2 [Cnaphalocrocis medinalis granulovirus]WPN08650.1 pep-2 [Cnaphalocrocis medinalis granulovirus]
MSVCLFVKTFDDVNVPMVYTDEMILWVGVDEVLRILKLSPQNLLAVPNSEKTTLGQLVQPNDSNCTRYGPTKSMITSLGVAILVARLYNKNVFNLDNNNCINNNQHHHLSDYVDAFANVFLTDVIVDLRIDRFLCNISTKEDAILNLLNEPTAA